MVAERRSDERILKAPSLGGLQEMALYGCRETIRGEDTERGMRPGGAMEAVAWAAE